MRDVNTCYIVNKLNVKDDAARKLHNRLQGNFVSQNVMNLPRHKLTVSEMSLLSKGHKCVPTSNTIDKAKIKI